MAHRAPIAVLVIFAAVVSSCLAQQPRVIDFPAADEPRSCEPKEGGAGRCVSLLSGQCSLYTSIEHLLVRRPAICAIGSRDAVICCPVNALIGGGAPAPTRPPTRPTRPPTRPTRPPTRPTLTLGPTRGPRPTRLPVTSALPTRATRPPTPPPPRFTPPPRSTRAPFVSTSRPSRPTSPDPRFTTPGFRPTRPTAPDPASRRPSGRPLNVPLGLRPRPTLVARPSPRPRITRPHRLAGCGVRQPLTVFRSGTDYFLRRPQFRRAEPATIGAHPWTALVGAMSGPESGSWLCAGVLLAPRLVLTAASCAAHGSAPDLLRVGLGEHDLSSRSDGTPGVHAVRAVRVHPAWAQPSRRHALALLLLDRPADRTPLISHVCLPPPDPPLPPAVPLTEEQLVPQAGSPLSAVAFHLDSASLEAPGRTGRGRLMALPATVAPLRDCGAALADAPLAEFLFPGGPQAGSDLCLAAADQCFQDAGSPLVTVAPDGLAQLEGLELLDNCVPGQPQMTLRIRHYVPWILETMDELMNEV